jgi:RNA polymerase sigma factor (sigma-70 family)
MDQPDELELAAQEQCFKRWQETGDPDALDELLRSEIKILAAGLRRRAGGALRPSVSASDLAQEAIYRMLRLEEPPRFEHPRELRAYLWNAAWRLLVNRMRSRRQDVVSLDQSASKDLEAVLRTTGGMREVEQREQADALNVVVNLLRAEDREILDLVYFRYMEIDAAAAKLGISRGACDMRLSRARRRLAERMLSWADAVS